MKRSDQRYFERRDRRRDGGFARDEAYDRPSRYEDRRRWDADIFPRGQSFDDWAYGGNSVDSDAPREIERGRVVHTRWGGAE